MIRTSPAVPGDIPAMMAMENELFETDRISRRQFTYLITKANGLVIKAELADQLAGYAVLLRRKNSPALRIYSIAVSPAAQRKGVARAMLAYTEKTALSLGCTRIQLEVDVANRNALRLYLADGFCLYGRKDGYYENGSDALLLKKNITPGPEDDSSTHGSQIHQ